jgi:hypothetical protein
MSLVIYRMLATWLAIPYLSRCIQIFHLRVLAYQDMFDGATLNFPLKPFGMVLRWE